MTGPGPGACLDCRDREQATAFGLCEVCKQERRERVYASIGDGDDGGGGVDEVRAELDGVNRDTVDTSDTSDTGGEPSGQRDLEGEPTGQMSLDAF